jgi:hypothetical protein
MNSGLRVCIAGALPLEPHLQSIFLRLFWSWDLELASKTVLPISASQVARITDVSHGHPATLGDIYGNNSSRSALMPSVNLIPFYYMVCCTHWLQD